MRNPLMWKLLRKHISKAQLIGFAIANMVGLTIVLLGLQFWQDVRPVFEDEDSFIRKDYLVVTKSIGTASMVKSMLGGTDANAFSESEIADLERQPWMRKVGRFSTTNYKVLGNLGISGRSVSLHTYIFFESVPDEFIDTKNIKWGFDANSPRPVVPILLSKDYLSLYNFGFAASQGMPQLSEDMVGKVPIMLAVTATDGHQEYIEGRIVGFSNRLNTIIVPESFMQWSNARYAPEVNVQPSRLILEVSKPGDVAIEKYMKKHGYEIAGDKMNSNKLYADRDYGHCDSRGAGNQPAVVLYPYPEHLSAVAEKHKEAAGLAAARLHSGGSGWHIRENGGLRQCRRLCAVDSLAALCAVALYDAAAGVLALGRIDMAVGACRTCRDRAYHAGQRHRNTSQGGIAMVC